jgi:hypothetical protein
MLPPSTQMQSFILRAMRVEEHASFTVARFEKSPLQIVSPQIRSKPLAIAARAEIQRSRSAGVSVSTRSP